MTGLARCVGDVDRFVAHHWDRAPLYRPGADGEGFADLLDLDDIDHIVGSSMPRLPSFRLVRDGQPLDPATYTKSSRMGGRTVSGVGDPGRIWHEFGHGATIVFQSLHRSWPPLARFSRQLEFDLTHPVQANAYVTPAGARGLGVHYDTHDVFVLQLYGTKAWEVHEPVLERPLPSQPWRSDSGVEVAGEDPTLSIELAAGDLLYLPRGFLHSARAQEAMSAHLTIGVLTTTWRDVVDEVMTGLCDEGEFRRSLPVGFADDERALAEAVAERLGALRAWLDKVDAERIAGKVARRFWSSRPPLLAGQLRDLLVLDTLTDRSIVRRREGSVCRLAIDGDRLDVVLGDRELHMPAALEPAMRWIAANAGDGFTAADLAPYLDGPSRLVLKRRLVVEGLLTVVSVD